MSEPLVTAPDKGARRPVLTLAAVLLVVAAVIAAVVFWRSRSPAESASGAAPEAVSEVQSVAVLPFSNLSGRTEIDYLALAVPDEITTALSYGYDLEVRPFSLTRKYQGPAIDPQAAGREVRATSVVTGQYGVEGDRLQVTLEAIDVEANSLIWRQRLSVEANDPLALRQVVAASVGEALLPALGGRTEEAVPAAPSNPEAYRLYLESLAISRDPEPNRRAIPVLERVVELDPDFAGAWTALAERWAFEGYYGGGSSAEQEAAMEKSERAARRALELNPNDLAATLSLSHRILELGRMGEAYEIAARLLAQNADRGKAHFMVSYIYRYVGLLEEAAAECNRALELSPTDIYLRSCVITFYRLGDFDRARDFLALDADTEWAYQHEGSLHLFNGDPEAAARLYGRYPDFKFFALLEACLADPDSEATRSALTTAIEVVRTDPDPEFRYHATALMAVCGFGQEALEYLPIVAGAGYCVPDVFEEGPFRSLAGQPGSQEAQAAHTACRDTFLAAKRRIDAALPSG